MRCPDCNKFVSYDEPNTDGVEVSLDGTELTLSGEIALPCAECGTDLASASIEANEDVSAHFDRQPDEAAGETAEYEMEDPDVSATDRSQETDRHGKRIKNPRYARRYYGAEASVTITQTIRDRDGKEVHSEEKDIEIGAEEQASVFDSLA